MICRVSYIVIIENPWNESHQQTVYLEAGNEIQL